MLASSGALSAFRDYTPGHWEDADGNWINGSWGDWTPALSGYAVVDGGYGESDYWYFVNESTSQPSGQMKKTENSATWSGNFGNEYETAFAYRTWKNTVEPAATVIKVKGDPSSVAFTEIYVPFDWALNSGDVDWTGKAVRKDEIRVLAKAENGEDYYRGIVYDGTKWIDGVQKTDENNIVTFNQTLNPFLKKDQTVYYARAAGAPDFQFEFKY